MKIIGITGGTGAGKSTLCVELERCGAAIIDSDYISRQVTQKNGAAFDEIVMEFGSGILASDGEIDRKALAQIVFNDDSKLELLNKITHKHIFAEMQRQLDNCKAKVAVLDVPLLFQSDFPFQCDLTVAVIADAKTRLERIMQRDAITMDLATARMNNQMTDEQYKAAADVCFVNDGDYEKIKDFANKLCEN